MLVIVAPDKFKGTLSAREAAAAIARGVLEVYPTAEVALMPLADGGDGTMDVLIEAIGGERFYEDVCGPNGAPVRAPLCRLADGDVFVEMALASGLTLLTAEPLDPLGASSEGTGRLIAAAGRLDPPNLIVGVGGSASTDGGTGAARALGWRFLDRRGRDLAPGGGALVELATIEPPAHVPSGVVGACDVSSPLIGPAGAARVFAAQKGATPSEVALLDRALENLRDVALGRLGIDIGSLAGGGAGGGMGAGLVAFLGAELRSGFALVAEATGFTERVAGAAFVLTGEGRIDEGTAAAKVPAGVARLARAAGVPCFAVAGEISIPDEVLTDLGFTATVGSRTEADSRDVTDRSDALVSATITLLKRHGPPV